LLYYSIGGTASNGVNYGNGWYRFNYNVTSGSVVNYGLSDVTGTGTCYIWGIQNEASAAYATSYIPTLGATSTRGQDICLSASIPSLIGQTEGTLFIQMKRTDIMETFFVMLSAVAGTTANAYQDSMYLFQLSNGGFVADVWVGNAAQVTSNTTGLSIGTHKLAIAYKQNDFVIYVDGVQRVVDTSGNVPAMNFFTIGGAVDGGPASNIISQAILFETRLSNSELAQLTTI